MTNVPPPDYDRHVGAHLAPTAPAFAPPFSPAPASAPTTLPPQPPTPRSPGKRVLGVIAAIALVLAPAVIGYQVGQSNDSSTGPSAINLPSSNQPANDPQSSGSSNGSTSNSSGSGTSGGFDVDAIADKADDSVININTLLDPEGAAAGTGILISSSGLAITNNHVINNSTEIKVEVPATGRTYSATVLGYNIVADVRGDPAPGRVRPEGRRPRLLRGPRDRRRSRRPRQRGRRRRSAAVRGGRRHRPRRADHRVGVRRPQHADAHRAHQGRREHPVR